MGDTNNADNNSDTTNQTLSANATNRVTFNDRSKADQKTYLLLRYAKKINHPIWNNVPLDIIKEIINRVPDGIQFATGDYHTILLKNGNVWGCGGNTNGQLGLPDQTYTYTPLLSPQLIYSSKFQVDEVAAGYRHTLIRLGHKVLACGMNVDGELGSLDTKDQFAFREIDLLKDKKINRIFAGSYNSMFIQEDGIALICGYNPFDRWKINNGSSIFAPTPIPGQGNLKIIKAAMCGSHIVFIAEDPSIKTIGLYGIGSNSYGQLGLGATRNVQTITPLSVPDNKKIIEIAVGRVQTLALTQDGEVFVCGSNNYGALGFCSHVKKLDKFTLLKLNGIKIKAITAAYMTSFLVTQTGELIGFGSNGSGELGLGNTVDQFKPIFIPGVANVEKVYASANGNQVFLKKKDGEVLVLGNNSFGQLGTENKNDQHKPTSETAFNRIINPPVHRPANKM